MEEKNENGPTMQIQTTSVEETAYIHESPPKNSTCLLNGYDQIEEDMEHKPLKNKKLPTKSRGAKISKLASLKRNRNTNLPKVASDSKMQTSTRNKRHLLPVSYTELESDSSSDDGVVFISRGCDASILNGDKCDIDENDSSIIDIPQEEISKMCDVENNFDAHDIKESETSQENSLENRTEMNDLKESNYQKLKPLRYEGITVAENNNFHKEEIETRFQEQNGILDVLLNDDYQKSNLNLCSSVKGIPQKETDSPFSETLSSLSEWGSTTLVEKEKSGPSKENRNNLDSEIIRQYMKVGTEVQSICNELETPNDDEIFNDFFNGNFDLDKYKAQLNPNKSASKRKEMEENCYETEALHETESYESPETQSYSIKDCSDKVQIKTDRKSGNAKDAKVIPPRFYNEMDSKNKGASNRKRSKMVKGNNFDDDNISLVHSDIAEDESDKLGGNLLISPKNSTKIQNYKRKQNNSEDRMHNVKTNSKNKNTLKAQSSTRTKGNYTYFEDNYTTSEQSNKEAGYKYPEVDDDSKGNSFNSPAENRLTNENKQKRNDFKDKVFDSKTNSKNKEKSKVSSSTRLKNNHISNLDVDYMHLMQGDEEFDENGLTMLDDNFIENSFDPTEKNHSRQKRNHSENNMDVEKTRAKNKDASNASSSTRIKKNYESNSDEYYSLSGQSDKEESGNNKLEQIEYDSFKVNSTHSLKKHALNKNKQKRNDSEESLCNVNLEQKDKTNNQLINKRDSKLWFSTKDDDQPANLKTKDHEDISSHGIKYDSNAKCVKKAPKTWADLEADILNREHQISLIPFDEVEFSLKGDEFSDGKSHHLEKKQNKSSFNRPSDKVKTEVKKTENERGIVKRKQEYSGHSACSKNINEVTSNSPNASIIDRVIRRMQLCTSPVLTPNKGNPKNPTLAEYSYSVEETKSVFVTARKSEGEKQTGKSEVTWKNTKQKNYRLSKKQEIKAVIDSKGASITNQTSVKLDEIPSRKIKMLPKSSESDNGSMAESNKSSELESEKQLSFSQDLLVSNADEPYNLRKRKREDNAYEQNATKTLSITGANNMNKSVTITKYRMNNSYNQSKQNTESVIKDKTREDNRIENFGLLNKKKKYNTNNFIDSSSEDKSDSEDSSQEGRNNCETHRISNYEPSTQANTHFASENAKKPDQSLQKQANEAANSMKVKKSRQRLPKRDSKEEYERYLKKIFSKDITVDSNGQLELQNDTNETTVKNLHYSNAQKSWSENSDEDLLSLSSDTDFEEQPSQRRASGLLDDVFN